MYNKLVAYSVKTLPITLIWDRELSKVAVTPDWETVWENISISSKNLAHQLIHFKLSHRFDATPLRRFQMKIVADPIFQACASGVTGTYLHMFWECPKIVTFWQFVVTAMGSLLGVAVPRFPEVLLLADDSLLMLTSHSRKLFLAGMMAAKKTILKEWMEQSISFSSVWLDYVYDLILERSMARLHSASAGTMAAWDVSVDQVAQLF
ncbi:UNVERIFIED_CONTAM: hypothetical protein FKN15_068748 [Acipenser sinensis]